jgi:hypothetical protein
MTCPICLENMSFLTTRVLFPCRHVYHTDCLQHLFCYSRSPSCSLCRREIMCVYIPYLPCVTYTPFQFLQKALDKRYKTCINCILHVYTPSTHVIYVLPDKPSRIRTFLFVIFFKMYIRTEIGHEQFRSIYWHFIMTPKLNHEFVFDYVRLFMRPQK